MKKVIIVDDEPNIVMSLEYVFKKEGYNVFIARDGEEAITITKNENPHIMLLDIMMPKVDGYQVLKYIKKDKRLKQLKVVVISAKSKTSDIELAINLGANTYFTKPFSVKKLVKKVKQLLK